MPRRTRQQPNDYPTTPSRTVGASEVCSAAASASALLEKAAGAAARHREDECDGATPVHGATARTVLELVTCAAELSKLLHEDLVLLVGIDVVMFFTGLSRSGVYAVSASDISFPPTIHHGAAARWNFFALQRWLRTKEDAAVKKTLEG